MLKEDESVKSLDQQALERLLILFERVPVVEITRQSRGLQPSVGSFDFMLELSAGGEHWMLAVEVKGNGEPRHVRAALHQMREHQWGRGQWVPILIAPYLSPQARQLCVDDGVSYLDIHGNARITFGPIYIEREVEGAPAAVRRGMKSLFRPKSARVLRVLLHEPKRPWRVTELAEAADVSLGLVSNIRNGLLDREWARIAEEGLVITDPGGLLDAWAEEYEAPAGKRLRFYTTLHGSALQQAVLEALDIEHGEGAAILASFSAARWLAPFGRMVNEYFYCDRAGLDHVAAELMLEPASKGENVVITVLSDDGIFRDAVSPAEGIRCTSAVQTYLDLASSGERGREAAEHLRRVLLAW